MNILMPISDGSSPSIFCSKMERTRPVREQMDRKVVYIPPDWAFPLWYISNVGNFPYF